MENPIVFVIDLNFLGRSGTTAAYLIPHSGGAILIETGPGSTLPALLAGIEQNGYSLEQITDVFLTHIHLDHAGASGWLARHGCRIHVHENGAPHLIDPERLLASAKRIYQDQMDTLWGEFIPVPEANIAIMHDREQNNISELSILALDVPGHANHHLAYLIGDACFTGDIGGIRLDPHKFLSLPMPPPDINLKNWRASIKKIQEYNPERVIPTHFGIYSDADWHLHAVLDELDDVETWLKQVMPQNLPIEVLRNSFIEFEYSRAEKYHITREAIDAQQIANASYTSADGLLRYWNKHVLPSNS
jgi:glyoxylase-like metal-dependent hydrolase (beta-lactamase superfamily II)